MKGCQGLLVFDKKREVDIVSACNGAWKTMQKTQPELWNYVGNRKDGKLEHSENLGQGKKKIGGKGQRLYDVRIAIIGRKSLKQKSCSGLLRRIR